MVTKFILKLKVETRAVVVVMEKRSAGLSDDQLWKGNQEGVLGHAA